MAMKMGFRQLVDQAMAEVETIPTDEAISHHGSDQVVFVDLRDPRELEREGTIPGAFRAPRGMLEFWVDPESPYFKPVFGEPKKFVLFCAAGWRSALATKTLQDMGLAPVAHIHGGFSAWRDSGGPVEVMEPRPKAAPAKAPSAKPAKAKARKVKAKKAVAKPAKAAAKGGKVKTAKAAKLAARKPAAKKAKAAKSTAKAGKSKKR